MGIHTTFTQEKADEICELLKQGKSLRKACEETGTKAPTVLGWTEAHSSFGEQYAKAREIGYLLLADDLLEISDDSAHDTYEDEQGNQRTNTEVVARSRLRVDSRKWMLSKMLPKIYGEKLELAGGLTLKKTAADMTDEELIAIANSRKQNNSGQ